MSEITIGELVARLDASEKLNIERDRRYEERFKAAEEAVKAALVAAKELTAAAFASSEKAIVKAEDAQKSYNERTNELRGALNDQNKTLLPRNEADTRFAAIEEKVEEAKTGIASLRESRSEGSGKDEAVEAARLAQRWVIGLAITVLLFLAGSLVLPLLKR
jgi:ABC-type Na+ efflux pump permease subunit